MEPTIADKIKDVIQNSGVVPVGTQTLESVSRTIQKMIQIAIPITQATELSGPEKKSAVVSAILGILKPLIAAIDIPYTPDFVEASVVDPVIFKVLESVLSSSIDELVALYNKFQIWSQASAHAMSRINA